MQNKSCMKSLWTCFHAVFKYHGAMIDAEKIPQIVLSPREGSKITEKAEFALENADRN